MDLTETDSMQKVLTKMDMILKDTMSLQAITATVLTAKVIRLLVMLEVVIM